jgi:hypothetical protein
VSPVKYELGFYIPEGDILHSHNRENLKSCRDAYGLELLHATCTIWARGATNPNGGNVGEYARVAGGL